MAAEAPPELAVPKCQSCGISCTKFHYVEEGRLLVCTGCMRAIRKKPHKTGPGHHHPMEFTPEEVAKRTERLRAGHRRWSERMKAIKRGELVDGLSPAKTRARRVSNRHWEVLMAHLSGMGDPDIARMLGYSQPNVIGVILRRPEIAAYIQEVRQAQLDRIIRGEFGVRAQAKAAAPKAMGRIIEESDKAPKSADRIKAARTTLEVAGELVQTHAHHHVYELMNGLTREELTALALRGTWPERLARMVEQLGIQTRGPLLLPPSDA